MSTSTRGDGCSVQTRRLVHFYLIWWVFHLSEWQRPWLKWLRIWKHVGMSRLFSELKSWELWFRGPETWALGEGGFHFLGRNPSCFAQGTPAGKQSSSLSSDNLDVLGSEVVFMVINDPSFLDGPRFVWILACYQRGTVGLMCKGP